MFEKETATMTKKLISIIMALQVQSFLRGIADSVDTTGAGSNVSQAVKDSVNTAADNMDTSNRIQEQTTAVQKQVKESILSIAKNAAKKLVSQLKSSVGWFVKMATK